MFRLRTQPLLSARFMRPLHSSSASLGRSAPSYFADEPGALLPAPGSPTSPSLTSPDLTKTLLKSEGFTFRHFPAEDAHFTNEPFASNPKLASILRCSTHGSPPPVISNPPTSVIPEEDPVLQFIPGPVSIILDDAMVGTQPPQSPLGLRMSLHTRVVMSYLGRRVVRRWPA